MYVSLNMCQAFELSSKGNTGMSHQKKKKNAYALTDRKENENKWNRMKMHEAITYYIYPPIFDEEKRNI